MALAWTGDELSRGQAQNVVKFDFEVTFDLEVQGQSRPKTIGILTKVFYIYGPNLVILAETGHELSRGQARDWRTDGHTHRQTDAGNDNTRRPILASGNKTQRLRDKLKFFKCELSPWDENMDMCIIYMPTDETKLNQFEKLLTWNILYSYSMCQSISIEFATQTSRFCMRQIST